MLFRIPVQAQWSEFPPQRFLYHGLQAVFNNTSCVYLSFKLPDAPCRFCTFLCIEFTGSFIRNSHKHTVMRPAQFATQCGANWKCTVKLPHITQSLNTVPFSEFSCQFIGKKFQQIFTVLRSVIFTASLVYLFSDFPISIDHCRVYRRIYLALSSNNTVSDRTICFLLVIIKYFYFISFWFTHYRIFLPLIIA